MKSNRILKYILISLVLIAIQLACVTGGNSGNAGSGLSKTEAALQATQNALSNSSDDDDSQQAVRPTPEEATNTPIPPSPTFTPVPPTPTFTPIPPTSTPMPDLLYNEGTLVYFTDFDQPGGWEDGWIQFSSADDYSIYTENGSMYFELPEENSSVVAIYDDLYFSGDQADVYVETYFRNLSDHNINNVSLVCRATSAGWYEFSMVSGGLFEIWKFEADSGYTKLADGGIPDLDYDAPHWLSILCVGNQFAFFVDGEQLEVGILTDNSFSEGQVGLSVYAYNWPDVIIEFDYFAVSLP